MRFRLILVLAALLVCVAPVANATACATSDFDRGAGTDDWHTPPTSPRAPEHSYQPL
jgi:hypothetical protein